MNISFIIPLFNEESTIRLCIDSIKAQLQSDDEIIVVDNGSTDSSLEKLNTLSKVTIISKVDSTISAVRNAGADIANGDIFAFIDADCVLSPNWRENVIKTLQDENISVTGAKVEIPENAVWLERAWYSQRDTQISLVSYINSGNLVVRKKVFHEVGGFAEGLTTGEDSEFGWRVNKASYNIISNPSIKSVHLGNPKNLANFYKKEKWHALGMLGTFKISWFDKPLIMTCLFVICNVIAACILISFFLKTQFLYAIVLCVSFSLLVPMFTAFYRSIQFKKVRYFFHLTLLYWIYFCARANVLFSIILNICDNIDNANKNI